MTPTYLSLFSGVGGFDLALDRAGFQCVGHVELDAFCRSVLALRFPGVRQWRDVRRFKATQLRRGLERGVPAVSVGSGEIGRAGERDVAIPERQRSGVQSRRLDLLVGGFPCQDLSVAGNRAGLRGRRSGLFWEIVRIAKIARPTWGLFENVPGLLSSHFGRDMWTVLNGLRECWPHVGYRILDSRYFGVAQRRRRVFLVGGPTEAGIAQVLALLDGGAGDSAASGEARAGASREAKGGADVAGTLGSPTRVGGFRQDLDSAGAYVVSGTLREHVRPGSNTDHTVVVGTLRGGSSGTASHSKPSGSDQRELIVSDPVSASEGRTYTHEGTKNFRLHNAAAQDPEIVRQAISSKWAKRSSGPAGDEHHNLIVGALPAQDSPRGHGFAGFASAQSVAAGHIIASTLSGGSNPNSNIAGRHREDDENLVFESRFARNGRGAPDELVPPLKAESGQTGKGDGAPLVFRKAQKAHDPDDCERWEEDDATDALDERDARTANAVVSSAVRRLTPLECERLQSFPDGWSCLCQPLEAYAADPDGAALACTCADSPRYRALGNAVTVSVVNWLGTRLRLALDTRT